MLTVYSRIAAGTPNDATATGNSVTWVKVNSVAQSNRKITTLRSMGASPTTGTISIDFAAQTQTMCGWSLAEFSGTDTTGTNGSGAIVQSPTDTNTTGTPSTTMTAFASTNNVAYYGVGHAANEGTTPATGFAEIHDIGIAENGAGIETAWKVNDNTLDPTWTSTTVGWNLNAIEIKAATTTFSKGNLRPRVFAPGISR
mgnify:CR=1 FL=1